MLQHVLATHSFFKNLFIFNWRVIASQCCVGFCQTLNESAIGIHMFRASLVAQMVKNLPVMWETWVWSWVGKIPWRRAWQPTPVFLPGESHGQRNPAGYSPWGRKESDMTERLSTAEPAYVPSLLNLPPHPAPLDYYRARSEFCEPHSKFLLAVYLTYGNVCFHLTLYIHPNLSFISPRPGP